jgi:hypothetical protein
MNNESIRARSSKGLEQSSNRANGRLTALLIIPWENFTDPKGACGLLSLKYPKEKKDS